MNFYTGDKGTNKQGLSFEVSNYINAKNIYIKFDADGSEVKTTRAYLTNGLPNHPTLYKPQAGDIYKDNEGNDFKLVERDYSANHAWVIEWIKDGTRASREYDSIKREKVQYPKDTSFKPGQVFTQNNGYTFEIIKQHNSLNVDIKFKDGTLHRADASSIRRGEVGHPTSGLTIGQAIKTNSGWSGEVVYYNNCHDVGIKWQDGSVSSHPAAHIKRGEIKPLYQPSVAGVGYFGDGRFTSKTKKGKESAPDVILDYWRRMIVRCYEPKEQAKPGGKSYIDVKVCPEWLNFQNFAEWALQQPNWDMKNDLDKDLLGTGLWYSPEYCTFLPSEVNNFLSDQYERTVHDLPKGVQYLKARVPNAKVGYIARCHTDKGREYLGYFDTPEQAFAAYKPVKEQYARILAERHKHQMTTAAYEKLMTFTITP